MSGLRWFFVLMWVTLKLMKERNIGSEFINNSLKLLNKMNKSDKKYIEIINK